MSETAPKRFQNFGGTVLALRDRWLQCAIAPDHHWQRTGPNGVTDSRPFEVMDSDRFPGLAKPGESNLNPDVSRAAHEKIASDLAALLDFPLPPVTIFDRGDGADSHRYICVSAWAFGVCEPWSPRIENKLTESQRVSAVEQFSAIHAFETWISAADRKSDHVLVNSDLSFPTLGLAFIDYAFSLSRHWTGPDATVGLAGAYSPLGHDQDVVVEAIRRIQDIDDEKVGNIVNRLPAEWLPEERAEVILSNLLSRKQRLLEIFGVAPEN